MKAETAQLLTQMADDNGNIECAFRESYSGRGMYGKTTSAIVVNRIPVAIYLAALAVDYLETAGREDEIDAFLRDIKDLGWDSMGTYVIIY